MISKHILTFLNEPKHIFFFFIQSNIFTYLYLIRIILFTIDNLFAHTLMFSNIFSITSDSIKHQSFIWKQLNDWTVLFQKFNLA